MSNLALTDRLDVQALDGGVLRLALRGDWLTPGRLPRAEVVSQAFTAPVRAVEFDVAELGRWNSGLVAFLLRCLESCQERQIEFRVHTLPSGLQRLLHLATAVPEKADARRAPHHASWLARVGTAALSRWEGGREALTFLGESALALGNLLRGKAQFRWAEAGQVMQACGPQALGIVALINFLVGLILAFVGAVQLSQFGAAIYVADLVAIGTVREMGCIMTGIILCGRTGAAFAAHLGSMKVNEELDAFRTFGISPIEFLVLPRLIALVLMMPLLCVFADLIAITGGYLVSVNLLEVTSAQYLDRTLAAITWKSFLLGIFKGAFFGLLVALAGCLRGLQCGPSAAGVGRATTSAVVTGITAIIVADGVFAVLCNALNI